MPNEYCPWGRFSCVDWHSLPVANVGNCFYTSPFFFFYGYHIFLDLICVVRISHSAMSFKRETRFSGRVSLSNKFDTTANILVCNYEKFIGVDGSRESPKLLWIKNISSSESLIFFWQTNYLTTPHGWHRNWSNYFIMASQENWIKSFCLRKPHQLTNEHTHTPLGQ